MTDSKPTVFIVDDDASVRKALRLLIKSVGLNVETYSSGREFLAAYHPSMPGCLVLDLRMPNMSGLELQDELRKRSIDIPLVFISGHGDVAVATQALKAGAMDFVEKPFSDQLLLESVQQAILNDQQKRKRRARHEAVAARMRILTPRERQIALLVVAGKASKQIAAELLISQKTVEIHRSHIMKKLGAKCVADVVRIALGGMSLPTGEASAPMETIMRSPADWNLEATHRPDPVLS